jgi:hypothetical protein
LQAAEVERRCARQRIGQQIQATATPAGAAQHRSEDTRIRRAKAARRFPDDTSLEVKHE